MVSLNRTASKREGHHGLESESGDGSLLERFVAHGDSDAFAALVTRHGPMVLAVCRARLSDPQDVEDAFQATFLRLVQKGATIRSREAIGHWLYRVAHRAAIRVGLESARHRCSQGAQALEVAAVETGGDVSLRDLQRALHEEINRLPESHRLPVVLCYLEGLTHEEAARRLGWPLGSVKGRLARARSQLRDRLMRRGLALASVLLALLALEGSARAEVSVELVDKTVAAARQLPAFGRRRVPALPLLAIMTGSVAKLFLTSSVIVASVGVTAYRTGWKFRPFYAAAGCHSGAVTVGPAAMPSASQAQAITRDSKPSGTTGAAAQGQRSNPQAPGSHSLGSQQAPQSSSDSTAQLRSACSSRAGCSNDATPPTQAG
jgi:RNA polymerase sigma factor (sigma-70 family)